MKGHAQKVLLVMLVMFEACDDTMSTYLEPVA